MAVALGDILEFADVLGQRDLLVRTRESGQGGALGRGDGLPAVQGRDGEKAVEEERVGEGEARDGELPDVEVSRCVGDGGAGRDSVVVHELEVDGRQGRGWRSGELLMGLPRLTGGRCLVGILTHVAGADASLTGGLREVAALLARFARGAAVAGLGVFTAGGHFPLVGVGVGGMINAVTSGRW